MAENTWPGGYPHAMYMHEHDAWNAENYPGTLELCCLCEEPTGCDGGPCLSDGTGPLCEECYHASDEYRAEQAEMEAEGKADG